MDELEMLADRIEEMDLEVIEADQQAFQAILSRYLDPVDPDNHLTIKDSVLKLGVERTREMWNELDCLRYGTAVSSRKSSRRVEPMDNVSEQTWIATLTSHAEALERVTTLLDSVTCSADGRLLMASIDDATELLAILWTARHTGCDGLNNLMIDTDESDTGRVIREYPTLGHMYAQGNDRLKFVPTKTKNPPTDMVVRVAD